MGKLGRELGGFAGVLLGDLAIAWRIDRDIRSSICRNIRGDVGKYNRWEITGILRRRINRRI